MGSTTYEWLLANDDTWAYPTMPTWVFTSRELPVPDGADVHFVAGSVADHQATLEHAAGDRDVWVVGGGLLAAQYQAAGLLDELRVTVMPIALGGRRAPAAGGRTDGGVRARRAHPVHRRRRRAALPICARPDLIPTTAA